MQLSLGRLSASAAVLAFLLALAPGSALANHVQCGETITQDTILDSDLTCAGPGIVVGAGGITLDLGGHAVRSTSTAVEVRLQDDVLVRRGTVVAPDGNGVLVRGARNRVTDITARARIGIYLEGVTDGIVAGNRITDASIGIFMYWSFRNQISGNALARITGPPAFGFFEPAGISVWQSSAEISWNRMSNNAADIRIAGPGVDIHHNRGQGSEVGVALDGYGADVTQNRFTRTGTGIAAEHSDDRTLPGVYRSRIEGNVVSKSSRAGISLMTAAETDVIGNAVTGGRVGIQLLDYADQNRVVGNRASHNAEDGIRVVSGLRENVVAGNEAHHNGDDGISVGFGESTVRGNTANHNGDFGIEVLETYFDVDGGGNRARHNRNPAQCLGVRCN